MRCASNISNRHASRTAVTLHELEQCCGDTVAQPLPLPSNSHKSKNPVTREQLFESRLELNLLIGRRVVLFELSACFSQRCRLLWTTRGGEMETESRVRYPTPSFPHRVQFFLHFSNHSLHFSHLALRGYRADAIILHLTPNQTPSRRKTSCA